MLRDWDNVVVADGQEVITLIEPFTDRIGETSSQGFMHRVFAQTSRMGRASRIDRVSKDAIYIPILFLTEPATSLRRFRFTAVGLKFGLLFTGISQLSYF